MTGPIIREEIIGDCRLILGDSLAVLPMLGKIDAVVSDPPYGINYVHGEEKSRFASKFVNTPIIGDDKPFEPSPLLAWPCVLWGANHFASKLPGGGAGGLSGTSATVSDSMTSLTSKSRG